jgi:hypothetical protein
MVRYVIQAYDRYPIYEPAEGGYYYEGLKSVYTVGIYDTKEEAIEDLKKYVEEENEKDRLQPEDEWYLCIFSDTEAFSVNHRYIGDGVELYVEPINRKGRHAKGWRPFE